MRNTFLLFASIALTVFCWGMYGPVLQSGQLGMSLVPGVAVRLRPFVCVGLAYFLIGVIVPSLWLYLWDEKGDWTFRGITWSLAGGALGAIGALGIILAMTFGGQPIYVMPLVFGGAPVVNAFLTIYLARRVKEIGPLFLAGLIIVIVGAVVVIWAAPHGPAQTAQADAAAAVPQTANATAAGGTTALTGFWGWISRLLAVALTVVCWGAYGPVLHKGQAAMNHSRMRPLICVGLSYFVIAVVVPYFFLGEIGEASTYLSRGTIWSLAAGAFGAAGALGIIMAFNSGGRPVFVMPLVFGGAPVINSMYTVTRQGLWSDISPIFWAGLILVVAGATMVLVLGPRGDKSAKSEESSVDSREAEEAARIEERGASFGVGASGEPLARG